MNSLNPIISVVVPIYKVEPYLERCLKSITKQTYSNLEIILVDDGSPDRCPEICDIWRGKDSRIQVIHKTNGGLSDARNTGLDYATGEYIAFVDSDDFIEIEMYEVLMKAAKQYDAQIVCCGRNLIVGEKKVGVAFTSEFVHSMDARQAQIELLTYGLIEEAAWDKLYKRDLFDGIRFPVGEINEDIVVLPRLIDRCQTIAHVAVPLYNYVQTPGSITQSGYTEKMSIYLKHIAEVSSYFTSEHTDMKYEISVFRARYALGMLTSMYICTGSIKKYKTDYFAYRKILNQHYKDLLRCSNFSKLIKIRCLCVVTRIYPIVKFIKDRL